MKRWIHSAEEVSRNTYDEGFCFNFRNKEIFLKSNKTNITTKIVRDFINVVCDLREVGDAVREKALYDEATIKDFRRRILKATLEHRFTDNGTEYYSIVGKDFTWNFPADDFEDSVIVKEARE